MVIVVFSSIHLVHKQVIASGSHFDHCGIGVFDRERSLEQFFFGRQVENAGVQRIGCSADISAFSIINREIRIFAGSIVEATYAKAIPGAKIRNIHGILVSVDDDVIGKVAVERNRITFEQDLARRNIHDLHSTGSESMFDRLKIMA